MTVAAGALVAAVAAALAWAELRRDRPLRAARAVAAVLAAASIAGLVLATTQPRGPSRARVAVIVTRGARPDAVRRLADSAGAAVSVLPDAGDPRRFGPGAIRAANLRSFLQGAPAIEQLIIAGWGLGDAALASVGDRALAFAPEPTPSGVGSIRWTGTVPRGGELAVRGATTGLAPGSIIVLDGPAGSRDSARVGRDSTFALSLRPRTEGRFDYLLRAAGVAETLGVAVTPARRTAVLLLEDAPSFESRYIDEWIRRTGGSLAARTRVSRDRFRTRFVGRDPIDVASLTRERLDSFDVALVDTRTLSALARADRTALRAAVRDGLGLVVMAKDGPIPDDVLPGDLGVRAGPARERRVSWNGATGGTAVALAPFRLATGPLAEALVADSSGESVAAWEPEGAGAILLTLVATPSRWQLEGNRERFAGYWSLLMGRVARAPAREWRATLPAAVDQPVSLTRRGGDSPAARIDSPSGAADSVYLAQDPLEPARWEGTWWPRDAGWHHFTDDSSSLDVRVSGGWIAREAAARRRATSARTSTLARITGRPASGAPRRLPDWVWFVILLGSLAFLWAAYPSTSPGDQPRRAA